MAHPILIAAGMNPVLRYKNRILASMAKKARKGAGVLGL